MSEELVKSVQDMLNEEKWTRAAISNYTKNQFIELATIIEQARERNCLDEVKAICDEHLAHTKNSIIALYFSGMIGLKKHTLDNSTLVTLVNIFIEQQNKQDIVVFLCESIRAEDETNKFALHTLVECYKNDDKKEEKKDELLKLYETIVQVDYEEAEIAKLLAEEFEKTDVEKSVKYYKKALSRFIAKRLFPQVKEIWSKLLEIIPEELEFFYTIQRKVTKNIGEDQARDLLQLLFEKYQAITESKEEKNQNWDICIEILKNILALDEKDIKAREAIVECYEKKYKNHSQLEIYIKSSDLKKNFRNVFDAINDFEKHIVFDVGNFVFHRSWGTGKITSIDNSKVDAELVINFGKIYREKTMKISMAIDALQPLSKNHIWVLKATKSKEALVKKIKEDKKWALKTIIKSFNNSCDFKQIKAELTPSLLAAEEWTSWSTGARKVLDSEPIFGVNPTDINMYTVRDRKITTEEKLANEFKAQKQFFPRIDILMRFFNEADTESEFFTEMFSYFTSYLKAFNSVNEQVVATYLVVQRVIKELPHLNPNFPYNFEQLFREIENPSEMYLELKDTKNTFLRKDFLENIKYIKEIKDYNGKTTNAAEIYIKLFPTVLQEELLNYLLDNGHKDMVTKLAITSFENYRDYRDAAIFFFRECQDKDWFKETNISFEKQMITLIRIMDIGYKEIENHYDTTRNKKIIGQIETLLFKSNVMLQYMLDNDENTVSRLYTLVNDVPGIDAMVKMTMRNRILEKYPEFKFYETEEKLVTPKGLIVTAKMYDIKKEKLEHIITVEVPANAKEIGDAIALGDLSENAEYKAARERQAQLNATATRLQDEIDRCQIFDPTTVTTARVSFGTTVYLETPEGTTEEYTILGPWESDPDNNIISYMSPLGNAIFNSKKGEKLSFVINEEKYNYIVKDIKIANI